MITVPELAADALGSFLSSDMQQRFGSSHARLAELVPSVARLALECIGNSDALYHNVEHTMLVTLAGRDILVGRALLAPTTPDDYAHLMVACLLHDIGYVRGILKDDDANGYVVDAAGGKVKLPRGSSDAALFMHHVDRSILFALDRIGAIEQFDAKRIARAIESRASRFRFRRKTKRAMKKVPCCAPPTSSASSGTRITCAKPTRSITSSRRPA